MIRAKLIATSCAVVIAALFAWGCSSANGQAPQFSASGRQHPVGWTQNHWAEYSKNPAQCAPCHGSASDSQKAGGTSGVSCFSCHAQGVGHPAGWADFGQHGRLGAELAPNPSSGAAMAGFAHCAKCHGSDYSGGVSNTSCKTCHTKAPHPDKPWIDTTGTKVSHTLVSFQNASECFKCHAAGANSTLVPTTPAPAGTEPGCFNNTMCHGNSF